MAGPADQPNQLIAFFRKGRKRIYHKGETILHAGDEPQGVYYIEQGFVKIYALSKDSTEHIHLFYSDGDIFPLIWAYSGAVRDVYYEALEETIIRIVPKPEFKAFVASDVEVAVTLLEEAIGLFRLYAGTIDNLLYSNSYERTAGRLLSLAYRYGKKTDAGFVIEAPLTHQHLANSINLSRETTSRVMERLQRKGIIAHNKRHIVVTDVAQLIAIIGEDEVAGMWPELADRAL